MQQTIGRQPAFGRQQAIGFAILFLSATLSAPSQADTVSPQDCRSIQDDRRRLACYDNQFGLPVELLSEDNVLQTRVLEQNGEPVSDLEVRLKSEAQLSDNRFVIIPHKQNYLLPATYVDDPNGSPSVNALSAPQEQRLDHTEVKYQISLKIPVYNDFLLDNATLWLGYTQLSLWQAYNSDASAPFRETNYEPEVFWTKPTQWNLLGTTLEEVSVGLVHQSNGRGEPLSRSWNRVYANFIFARNNWAFALKPWYRLPEEEDDDDNPDIDDYLGYADFLATYKLKGNEWGDYVLSAKVRNNFKHDDNHTSTTLGLSFPLPGRLNGYIEYVDGYGETLIDYNHRNQRIGVGFILNDWY